MRVVIAGLLLLSLAAQVQAQKKTAIAARVVTVPATIDHNRVVIQADLRLPDGSTHTVPVWVDNGNPDLYLSRRVATLLSLPVQCGDQECSSPAPAEIVIGGMIVPLTAVKEAKIPLRPVNEAAVLALGINAEVNLPSSILRQYNVLIDFVDRKFSIGAPGTIHFHGSAEKALVNGGNGLIQVPSQIDGKKYNLALDVGSCISFLSEEVFDKLEATHADWPRMTGAVGSANIWGSPEEAKWRVMSVDRLQFGPLFLTNVPMVALPKPVVDFFEKRAVMPTVGLLGSNVLLNYRVGLDYSHSTVYFDLGRTYKFPDFDVVGLILRPEGDGRFTVLGVADIDGKPSVDGVESGDHLEAVNDLPVRSVTMGQVWSMLGGTPEQEKKLTIERAGKEFSVAAKVTHFLAESRADKGAKKK
jgi:Aspartyl protease